MKAFAEDGSDVAKVIISVFDRVENIVGNGENASEQHFLLFPQYFLFSQRQLPSFELHLICRLQNFY